MAAYGIKEGNIMVFSSFKRGREDIGEFDTNHSGKVGSSAL